MQKLYKVRFMLGHLPSHFERFVRSGSEEEARLPILADYKNVRIVWVKEAEMGGEQ